MKARQVGLVERKCGGQLTSNGFMVDLSSSLLMIRHMENWLLIVSTILGPVLAVQAQKWVERARERKNRKAWIFHTLMATRGNRTDVNHVQALNMIELGFYGYRFLGIHKRTKTEENVLNA